MHVVVLDLGTSNVRSLTAALAWLGAPHTVATDGAALDEATHLLLPGVGAWDAAMTRIDAAQLRAPIVHHVRTRGRPLLGICLGMQLLFEASEEGTVPGLGLLPGRFRQLAPDTARGHAVPHARFSRVSGVCGTGLFAGLGADPCFYFTHSFALSQLDGEGETAWCEHSQPFVAAFTRGLLSGAQFHPEKSQGAGLRLLANFLQRDPAVVTCAA
jgi:glutamine amidotransferase